MEQLQVKPYHPESHWSFSLFLFFFLFFLFFSFFSFLFFLSFSQYWENFLLSIVLIYQYFINFYPWLLKLKLILYISVFIIFSSILRRRESGCKNSHIAFLTAFLSCLSHSKTLTCPHFLKYFNHLELQHLHIFCSCFLDLFPPPPPHHSWYLLF